MTPQRRQHIIHVITNLDRLKRDQERIQPRVKLAEADRQKMLDAWDDAAEALRVSGEL